MIHRRGFLGSLMAFAVAPFLPTPSLTPPKPQGLMFHPDAFKLSMEPVSRMDVIYGFGTIQPEFAVRAWDYSLKMGDGYRAYIDADQNIQRACNLL